MVVTELPEQVWRARRAAHEQRVDRLVGPHLERRRRRQRHPVHDFLFSYYSFRPAQLRRWHPGYGVSLAGGDVEPVTREYVAAHRPVIESVHALLTATARRPAHLGCFGLHEWAMVYRAEPGGVRHASWPLRLGGSGTDRVVETHRIRCSHFDAYRFFTSAARPRNALRPGSGDRPAYEQPGCLHAGMDLYKHAFRLAPMTGSDVVADAFELAWDIRIVDMRAAPYDLTGLTLDPTGEAWTPVEIETPDGKREYQRLQQRFSERAAPIRQHLLDECERLLAQC